MRQPTECYAGLPICNSPTSPTQVAGLQRSLGYGARIPVNTRSLPAVLAAIWAAEGARGLYKGALPSIIKAAPSAAVTLSAYEVFLGHLAALAEPAPA